MLTKALEKHACELKNGPDIAFMHIRWGLQAHSRTHARTAVYNAGHLRGCSDEVVDVMCLVQPIVVPTSQVLGQACLANRHGVRMQADGERNRCATGLGEDEHRPLVNIRWQMNRVHPVRKSEELRLQLLVESGASWKRKRNAVWVGHGEAIVVKEGVHNDVKETRR